MNAIEFYLFLKITRCLLLPCQFDIRKYPHFFLLAWPLTWPQFSPLGHPFQEGLQALITRAQACSHLADDAASVQAATVSKQDTRRGHSDQHAGDDIGGGMASGAAAGDASSGEAAGWRRPWGLTERRLVAGAVVVDELRSQVRPNAAAPSQSLQQVLAHPAHSFDFFFFLP